MASSWKIGHLFRACSRKTSLLRRSVFQQPAWKRYLDLPLGGMKNPLCLVFTRLYLCTPEGCKDNTIVLVCNTRAMSCLIFASQRSARQKYLCTVSPMANEPLLERYIQFHVPFARVSTVQTGIFTRLVAQANGFIARNPQVDFLSDTFSTFKSFAVALCRNMPFRSVSQSFYFLCFLLFCILYFYFYGLVS